MTKLHYAYKHSSTEATTGYFSCVPEPALELAKAIEILAQSPLDEFLHSHILRELLKLSAAEIMDKFQSTLDAKGNAYGVLSALLLECSMLSEKHAKLKDLFDNATQEKALEYTPLLHLDWHKLADKDLHRAWVKVFSANIVQHNKLPHPEELADEGLSPLFSDLPKHHKDSVSIKEVYDKHKDLQGSSWSRPPSQQTAQQALSILVENDIIDGGEMRHEASLSPIALLRNWKVRMKIDSARHNYTVEGKGTTYGRGLSLADARASYSMEMIERASAYASVENNHIVGLTRPTPVFHAKYSELIANGTPALDPNTLPLEVAYNDAPLYWMEAEEAISKNTVLVPVQAVYLFCNLDEKALFMNAGSTGLATANTLAEAKIAALIEILERDSEAVTPYTRRNCFTLRSNDERIQALFDDYKSRGINIQFLDLTTEFGVPCYQAFVMDKKGEVVRATGAGLNGTRAAISALTEVPYPYPNGPASGPLLAGLEERVLEELPDYTLKSPTQNLALLEDVLIQNGYTPLYVEISQEDLEFPVVRAIIPELELGADFDDFSRISSRLYANYLKSYA